MKPFLLAAAAALSFAGLADAQEQHFTPAPVPNVVPQQVDPAFRAAGPVGAQVGTPFSGQPSTLMPGPGQDTPATDLSRVQPSAPTPALTK